MQLSYARYYDASLGRFVQADSIIPLASQGSQAFDRYAYVNNSPVNFSDSTGHTCEDSYDPGCVGWNQSHPYDPVVGWNGSLVQAMKYDGHKAAEYAEANKNEYIKQGDLASPNDMQFCNADCTNFASWVLTAGGFQTDENSFWKKTSCFAENSAWIDTNLLYKFLTQKLGFKVYGVKVQSNLLAQDRSLQDLMNRLGDVDLSGSLIFYSSSTSDGSYWNHVAIFTSKSKGVWQIIDHSGPTSILPRSYNSSPNPIYYVAILVLPNIKK